ncbi:MAG: HU family DNA-binding protein [Patescibacteria group bacterium]
MYGAKPLPGERVDTDELINRVAAETGLSQKTVEKITSSLFEQMTHYLEQCRPINIKDFGTFFIRPTTPTRTFKFNPSQRLRAIFGWSSTYKGK